MNPTCLFSEVLPDSNREILRTGQVFKLFGHMIWMEKEPPADLVDGLLRVPSKLDIFIIIPFPVINRVVTLFDASALTGFHQTLLVFWRSHPHH